MFAGARLPVGIPDITFEPSQLLTRSYGLPREARLLPRLVKEELICYEAWSRAPVRLDRGGPYAAGVQSETWDTEADCIHQYLGFLVMTVDMELAEVTMGAYADPYLLVTFIAFLLARKLTAGSIQKHCVVARKVITWLKIQLHRSDPEGTIAEVVALHAMVPWLHTLSQQLSKVAAPSPSLQIKAILPPAKEVLRWQRRLEREAFAAYKAAKERWGGMIASVAWMLHNIALLALLFGYLPTLRLACVRTALHPDHAAAAGRCSDPDCCNPASCSGNRLEWAREQGRELKACFPHHKTEFARVQYSDGLSFFLSQLLCATIELYIREGHPFLTQETGCPFLFLNQDRQHMGSTTLPQWFIRLQSQTSAPWTPFPPYMLRHVFATERGAGAGPGPSAAAAAVVMGNSPQEWARTYDLGFRARAAQEAVNAMAEWRESMLRE